MSSSPALPAELSLFRAPHPLPDYQCQRLLQAAGQDGKTLECLALYVFAQQQGVPDAALIADLLAAESCQAAQLEAAGWLFVLPRPGSLSPWSSRATEIFQRCGMPSLQRVERALAYRYGDQQALRPDADMAALLHDRMTEVLRDTPLALAELFRVMPAAAVRNIDVLGAGEAVLQLENQRMGLALSASEIAYLVARCHALGRNLSDVELMMFAQANSEHCRHKRFRCHWTIDGKARRYSLFDLIRRSSKAAPTGILSAYHDNAAVIAAPAEDYLEADARQQYRWQRLQQDLVIKAETHNHPTAISPFPGAATGSGGEIRDEAATGRGGLPRAGFCGFAVSDLHIPALPQPWEQDPGRPSWLQSPLAIMLEGPIGAARFGNEFGRPTLAGFFRTLCQPMAEENHWYGFHKPLMLAGGQGRLRRNLLNKASLPTQTALLVIGGPALRIGLGGGATSSLAGAAEGDQQALYYASVQRSNPEMQRRCQEVITKCAQAGDDNPLLSLHDVGAGGLANALPELVHEAGRGGCFDLAAIPSADSSLSPLELWCNEAQERYVLAIDPARLAWFFALCARERCPYAAVGTVTAERRLRLAAPQQAAVVDMPLALLLGDPPLEPSHDRRRRRPGTADPAANTDWQQALARVLQLPAVAAKDFLVTIQDRSVSGLVAGDQMVGRWQLPLADVALSCASHRSHNGSAMALGERMPLAILNPAAACRMAVAEAITNLAAARIAHWSDIKLSANWMAAVDHPSEGAALYDGVEALGRLCRTLGLAVPVGKDSLSMTSHWRHQGQQRTVLSPLSVVVSAFAPALDVRQRITPLLQQEESALWLLDLGQGRHRLGASALAQVYRLQGRRSPDLNSPLLLRQFFALVQELQQRALLLAYHDRSDGGLLSCLCEMAFAADCGLSITIPEQEKRPLAFCFNEEAGAVLQIAQKQQAEFLRLLDKHALRPHACRIATPQQDSKQIVLRQGKALLLRQSVATLRGLWSRTSYQMQALRDNPECARQLYQQRCAEDPAGLVARPCPTLPPLSASCLKRRPAVAILREQGSNGQLEMAAAFDRAGFTAVDVHMSDLLAGRKQLQDFVGLAACGGFSYGDVLGAGRGWAASIRHHPPLRQQFADFFADPKRFALGVCNGCQMLAELRDLIPGSSHWPQFQANLSQQYEGRLAMVRIEPSPSLFFAGMAGSLLPIPVSHGEGRVTLSNSEQRVTMRYADANGAVAQHYPDNPNGSVAGIAGLSNEDGRIAIMMPHPERAFRSMQLSWHPPEWGEDSPWLELFLNARRWLG